MTTLDDLARVVQDLRTSLPMRPETWADTIAAYVKAQRERDAANGWQPIKTAPRDGSFFLAVSAGVDKRTGRPWQPGIVAINADGDYVPDDFHEDYFTVCANEWPVTHWMPLPAPPKEPTP